MRVGCCGVECCGLWGAAAGAACGVLRCGQWGAAAAEC